MKSIVVTTHTLNNGTVIFEKDAYSNEIYRDASGEIVYQVDGNGQEVINIYPSLKPQPCSIKAHNTNVSFTISKAKIIF